MSVWNRYNDEQVVDFQPPPYSEYWQYYEDVKVLDLEETDHRRDLLDYETVSLEDNPKFLSDLKVPCHNVSELRQRRSATSLEGKATVMPNKPMWGSSSHRRLRSKDSIHSSHLCKISWLRNLKSKHARKNSKGASLTSNSTLSPKFTAIPISLNPPKVTNKIILPQNTITLFDPTGRTCFEASPFQITLSTTLHENQPYTFHTALTQRSQTQTLESSLSHFDVIDIETGYVLSEKPAPIPAYPPGTAPKPRKSKHPATLPIRRDTCTELAPHTPSLLTLTSYPSPSKSSTERIFDGLRIRDPTLLVGRRLRLRLRPTSALWSARGMGEVFGFGDEVAVWPDMYGLPLVMGSEDGEEDGVEFRVLESVEDVVDE